MLRGVSVIAEKTLAIRVDEDFYKKVRMRLAEKGLTLKDYFVGLVEADIQSENPSAAEECTEQDLIAKADEIIRLLKDFKKK